MLRQTRYRFPRENYGPYASPSAVSLRSGGLMVEAKKASTYEVEFSEIKVGEPYGFIGRLDNRENFSSFSDVGEVVKEIRLISDWLIGVGHRPYNNRDSADSSIEGYLRRFGGKLAVITSSNLYEIEVIE